jgi:ubiquinone/menaquinone biosynthesis C-methylase UbiE
MGKQESDEAPTRVHFGPGFHAAAGRPVDPGAYDKYTGLWSRLFVPSLLAAAEVGTAECILDVAAGPGEAALLALEQVGPSGLVVGADISLPMLDAARARLSDARFCAVVADGQVLPFADGRFDAVLCQLGLMFFPDPARGMREFRRVLRPHHRAAVCVISAAERAPTWSVLADTLGRYLPDQWDVLHLMFSLAEASRLEQLFAAAGFSEISVTGETREHSFATFDEYWAPIEKAPGSLPQAYRALPFALRQAVREEVCRHLARFEVNGRLVLSIEMLIGAGRA